MLEPHRATTPIDPLPTELDTSQAKLVYLSLEATGGATATDLSETLAMTKLSILSVLRTLADRELIERNGAEYVPAT
ncbi:MarR family transcriptional regulator [Natrialbaceae archaeon GCM10025810]|uniref:MarR family transcriptional regulator n=1 Tax=Halovalidus salilacus TaxID=3075124 RepID=UPI0036220B75